MHAILPDEQGGFKITGIYFATEPDSLESLRLQNARMTATGMQMSFAAAAGKAYTVQYSEGLATANWLTLTNVPSQEASSSVSITDPGPLSRQRFYRVMSPGSL